MASIGVVPYLNALPLVEGLPADLATVFAVPATLSHLLDAAAVDAALLPVAEAFRGTGGARLGSFGIACEGAVETVLLFVPSADPAAWPRRVVLDPASRSSATLLRCLLASRWGLEATYEESPTAGPDPAARPDAMTLVIGDPAARRRAAWRGEVVDLGQAWTEWTGLPFVFAAWVARRDLPEAEAARLAESLDAAAERGLARLPEIARVHGPSHGMEVEAALRYLTRSVRYRLGPREVEGLERFESLARRLGLV